MAPVDTIASRPLTGAVFAMGLALLATSAHADVYVYADEHGVEHFTNTPDHAHYQRLSSLMEAYGKGNRAGAEALKGNVAAFAPQIEKAADEAGVEAALVHAVITAESGYNPQAVSRVGAQGLMQLMPATARRYAVKDAFDPRQNIRGGTRYLRDLLDMFDNNVELAVAAYNAGENAVIRHGRRIPPYRETQAYVPKVLALYRKYRTLL
jgi:soluble lytic murein transglycosylase-like protein